MKGGGEVFGLKKCEVGLTKKVWVDEMLKIAGPLFGERLRVVKEGGSLAGKSSHKGVWAIGLKT